MDTETTKGRIMHHSILLFGKRGYEGVSIREISHAVGIKESSIYNHFSSKQEILDEIMYYFKAKLTAYQPTVHDVDKLLETETPREILSHFIYLFAPDEADLMLNLLRILFMEQYRNAQIKELLLELLLNMPIRNITDVLNHLIKLGKIPPCNSELLAQIWVKSCLTVAIEATHGIKQPTPTPRITTIVDYCIELALGTSNCD